MHIHSGICFLALETSTLCTTHHTRGHLHTLYICTCSPCYQPIQEHSEAERDFGKVDHAHSSPVDDEFNPWSEAADGSVWGLQDEGGEGFQYVNLELNPEKFTG